MSRPPKESTTFHRPGSTRLFDRQTESTRVAVIYFLVGVLWIFTSDRLLEWFGYAESFSWGQSIKGICFVSISSVFLYWLVGREGRNRERASDLLRAVTEGTSDAVFVKDRDGRYLLTNPAAARFMGKSPAEILGRDDTLFFDPDGVALIRTNDQRVMSSDKPETAEETLTSAGVTRTFLATKAPYRDDVGRVIGVIGVSRDITNRKEAERQLHHEREFLRAVLENTAEGVIACDAHGRITLTNKVARTIHGVSEESLFQQRLEEAPPWHHPDGRPMCRDEFPLFLALQGEVVREQELLIITPEVGRRTVLASGKALHDLSKNKLGAVLTLHDITNHRQAEADLLLRDRAIQAATQGIVITDVLAPDNPIIYASPGFEQITGYPSKEVIGRNCRFLQGPDTDRSIVDQLRTAIRAGDSCTVELLNYRKDGTPFWNQLYISPVWDDWGRLSHFVGVQADVTERRSLEEQYRQAQKMEAVGQLAGGVAHDFNNLLTIITGYSELLLQSEAVDNPNVELIREIHRAAERSASLTRQLLVFSRKQIVSPRVLDINTVIADAEKMLRRVLGENLEVVIQTAPTSGRIQADPGQLDHMLVNLSLNARDAMPRGGRLTIQTETLVLTTETDGLAPGSYVRLTFSDTGTGMTPEVCERIFEPFFTTKEPGKGTGLGLSVVHGLVKQLGGSITVQTQPGEGTTFRIYLPTTTEPQRARDSTSRAMMPSGTETVLVVEDERALRDLTVRILTRCGYHILQAGDGTEALTISRTYDGRIHLLVTDLVLPGMNGREVAEVLTTERPEIKVLYTSGYTDDAIIRQGITHDEVAFLQKPFTPRALAITAREFLDSIVPGP